MLHTLKRRLGTPAAAPASPAAGGAAPDGDAHLHLHHLSVGGLPQLPPGVEATPLVDVAEGPSAHGGGGGGGGGGAEEAHARRRQEAATAHARRRSSVSAVTDEAIAAAVAAVSLADAAAGGAPEPPAGATPSVHAERGARAALLLVDAAPLAAAATAAERSALLKHKLALCGLLFAWEAPPGAAGRGAAGALLMQQHQQQLLGFGGGGVTTSEDPIERRGKAAKAAALTELIQCLDGPGGGWLVTEPVLPQLLAAISTNVFRALPVSAEDQQAALLRRVRPSSRASAVGADGAPLHEGGGGGGGGGSEGGAGGEDEPALEPSWPHLELVYELLLRVIMHGDAKPKAAKKHIDAVFCVRLIDMFATEDPRER